MIYPLNRYLTVKPIEQKKDEEASQILLPEVCYENSPSAYMLVEVIEQHAESKLRVGMHLVAPRSAVEVIDLGGETHYLLLENHAMGFLNENK
jgi:hypothetical protein|tara:strand:- start:1002 stop:1280 length:279 start_codon:yes stop_codon:yes gene_type:complete